MIHKLIIYVFATIGLHKRFFRDEDRKLKKKNNVYVCVYFGFTMGIFRYIVPRVPRHFRTLGNEKQKWIFKYFNFDLFVDTFGPRCTLKKQSRSGLVL